MQTIIDFTKGIPENVTFEQDDNAIVLLADGNGTLAFNFSENLHVNLTLLFLPSTNLEKRKKNFIFNITAYTQLQLNVANLTNYDVEEGFTINLIAPNSRLDFYSATIANGNTIKRSFINPIHFAGQTISNITAYEVLKNAANGFIRCVSDIKKGSGQSEAHQELRLLVLDETAKADSDPVLLIDENDIVASHANAIGMLDQDQIFYLKSRGLDETTAEELILNGYFEPIFAAIEEQEISQMVRRFLKAMI